MLNENTQPLRHGPIAPIRNHQKIPEEANLKEAAAG